MRVEGYQRGGTDGGVFLEVKKGGRGKKKCENHSSKSSTQLLGHNSWVKSQFKKRWRNEGEGSRNDGGRVKERGDSVSETEEEVGNVFDWGLRGPTNR